MGHLSYQLKSIFLELIKCLSRMNWLIVFLSLINLSVCIYEDQIGKFDWRQSYVGRIKFAQFDTVSTAKKIIVATEENVLAALHLKTGEVVWRHVFESTSAGDIQLLHVGEKVLTVTGSNPYLVRGWNPTSGVLLWEWSLTINNDKAEHSQWWVHHGLLYHMLPVFGSHIEVTTYNMVSGQNRGATSKLPAVWTNSGCVFSTPFLSCVSGGAHGNLMSLDVTSNVMKIITKPVSYFIDTNDAEGYLRPLDGNSIIPGFILDNKKVITIRNSEFEPLNMNVADKVASVSVIDSASGPLLLQSWHDDIVGFALTAYSLTSSSEVHEVRTMDRSLYIPEPTIETAMCTKTPREQYVCRILINGADDSVNLLQHGGRVVWTREEALANVATVEFVDFPVSDLEAAIESEFDQKEGSIWGAFTRRLQSQIQQLNTFIQSWAQIDSGGDSAADTHVRDYFNLHKMMVIVTKVGKIFGMNSVSGGIVWRRYVPALDGEDAVVYTRRHPPLHAYLTVGGRHYRSGNGLLISLDPLTGELVAERVLELDVAVKQAGLLTTVDHDHTHALVLLLEDDDVMVLPKSSERLLDNYYMFVAEPDTATVHGYAIKYDGKSAVAVKLWSVKVGGPQWRIVAAVSKPVAERVHSAGRVMNDRSVLYKYLNPNLVLVVSEGPDPVHKDVVVGTLLDGVSGAVVTSQSHRRCRDAGPALLSEHFAAYVYYNDKLRRTEIATLELYVGPLRRGATWSSWWSAPPASISRAAYVLPPLSAATLTRTLRAVTDRHALLALRSGAVLEMPWALLEPRRWSDREEGLIPYAPELPVMPESIINYNVTLQRVDRLHVVPAGLESTCLVLATGLDLYYTRVAPSKTFDLLKEDFDYSLITIVLAGLIAATYSTKYFASKKMLKMAWK